MQRCCAALLRGFAAPPQSRGIKNILNFFNERLVSESTAA
jgi:hypothetical protein